MIILDFAFKWVILVKLVTCASVSFPSVVDIEIITTAYYGVDSMTSLNYLMPAFESGLDSLRRLYPHLNVSHRFLIGENVRSCSELQAEVQDILSRWYYHERRNGAVPVIINSGECEHLAPLSVIDPSEPSQFWNATKNSQVARTLNLSTSYLENGTCWWSPRKFFRRLTWFSVVMRGSDQK